MIVRRAGWGEAVTVVSVDQVLDDVYGGRRRPRHTQARHPREGRRAPRALLHPMRRDAPPHEAAPTGASRRSVLSSYRSRD